MKLLFFGDTSATGFGTVTQDLCRRFLALGVDVRIVSQNQTMEPIPHPMGERTWDVTSGVLHAGFRDGWVPDTAVIVSDFVGARNLTGARAFVDLMDRVPSFHYCPVEGIGLPPRWNQFWSVVRPVAMSEFGADQMATVVGYRPPVIPHGVDTDAFYPIAPNRPGYWKGKPVLSKDAAKVAIGRSPERTIVLRTDRHMPRKQQNRLIAAMVPVLEAETYVDLILHCSPLDEGGNLHDTLSKVPETVADRVFLSRGHDTFRGLSRADLNVLYNAADLYVSNSAEGFGLTIAEAMAAGVPVVGLDYSAVPELIGDAGVVVPYSHLVENEYDHYWAAVDIDALTAAVLRLVRKPSERRALGAVGPRRIAQHYTWDRAAALFGDLIEPKSEAEAAA